MAFGSSSSCPKVIWMLWLQGWDKAPEIARLSRRSWEISNPGWRVEALTLETAGRFIPQELLAEYTATSKPPEALANLIRTELLYRYGGVWADATTLCARPLDDWLPTAIATGFFAFHQPGPDRMLSNWFLAASKGSRIIADWREEGRAYWEGRSERDIYFWHHRCFAWAYEKHAEFRKLWDSTPKIPAANPFHFGPNSAALLAPPGREIEALLKSPPVPVFKLTHKFTNRPDEHSLYQRLLEFAARQKSPSRLRRLAGWLVNLAK
ncbi:capsular polysaccharide synthesis protein [Allorhizobium undicola]|uniref:capsular polysaccharide synthesis protein n=1 Tax=Allorhizobium undicola TaxID=78527 RepID=UPI0012B5DC1D|nr:capsular polysaccharide synthesis protein [Allorhizobium undicola]